jgi:hypothetical protein
VVSIVRVLEMIDAYIGHNWAFLVASRIGILDGGMSIILLKGRVRLTGTDIIKVDMANDSRDG